VLFRHASHHGAPAHPDPPGGGGTPAGAGTPGHADPAGSGGSPGSAGTAGHASAPDGHDDAPAIAAVRDLLDAGVAAGAYTVADTATTAVLFHLVMHAFDPDDHGHRPDGGRLVAATRQLFRRTAGLAGAAST
jgi:hypothetical protein